MSRTGTPAPEQPLERLLAWFRQVDSAIVAFSGGVDSTLLARIAHDALGQRALAVTAVSASLAPRELKEAKEIAQAIGIRHRTVESRETFNPLYQANTGDRCFHCKSELFAICRSIAEADSFEVVVEGTNLDDLGDHRPGRRAAEAAAVRSPFVELGIDKATVRHVSRSLGLPTADKPEMACLASRFPTGTPVTLDGLDRVARAENVVAELGFRQWRVRFHGDLARLELLPEDLDRLADPGTRSQLLEGVRAAGFRFVTVDLEGYVRGSGNPLDHRGEE